ncbi:MAG: class I SAM-dependent methyltransferase [Proteobacteria bacterium]|nr:class I SAM-dependent methyltransferase [Pseudomonadota bacterium]
MVIDRLIKFYKDREFDVATGLNPCHFGGHPYAPFTWLIKDGRNYTNGLGIALQEIYFLENLCAAHRPHSIFIIGNSFGWSTLALALINPEAQILAIDAGFDGNSFEGLELTNEIAEQAGLQVRAVKAVSPQDVDAVMKEHLNGSTDFDFVDGLHTNDQIVIDFEATRGFLHDDGVMVFHDVHEAKMREGFSQIEAVWLGESRVLMATPSGIGVLFPSSVDPAVKRVIEAFSPSDETIAFMEQQVWNRRHRHLARWKRSFNKRIGKRSTG